MGSRRLTQASKQHQAAMGCWDMEKNGSCPRGPACKWCAGATGKGKGGKGKGKSSGYQVVWVQKVIQKPAWGTYTPKGGKGKSKGKGKGKSEWCYETKKTGVCPRGGQLGGCKYLHPDDPVCWQFVKFGSCKKGDACEFAHEQ